MSESKAAEDYMVFESLRSRFSDASIISSSSSPTRPSEPRKSSKRRFDPRSNAPPLRPLIEEGDQLQEAMVSSSGSPVRGTWKHANQAKCNHLNGPEFDALETSSTTSLSSAYSEPGNFSPLMGSSLSELSDAGSCETFSEYDIKRNKSRIASLKASFERSTHDNSHSRSPKHKENSVIDADVPENFVNTNKKAWDRVIGDWVFNGVQQSPTASPSKPKMRRPSSEVRVPTPLSTPLGSTDNLLIDSGSRSSMLSNNESTVSSDDYPNGWNFERKPYPGRLLNKPPSRPSSASCIQTNYKRKSLTAVENDDRSSSETNLLLQTSSTSEPVQQDETSLQQSNAEEESSEDVALLQPKEYKMGKFLSISDTMLPAEERTHEYIAESPAPPPPAIVHKVADEAVKKMVREETPVEEENGDKKEAKEEENREENPAEDEVPPRDYQPGKFVTQNDPTSQLLQSEETKDTTATADEDVETADPPPAIVEAQLGKFVTQNNTTSMQEDVGDTIADQEKSTPLAITNLENGEDSANVATNQTSERSSKTADDKVKVQPSNRWFDAYMKCKAAQAKLAPVKKRIPLVIKEAPPVKKQEEESPAPKEPPVNASTVNMDDFEKVQKITPSRSQKWREAMQKYKALEQIATSQSVQASGGEENNSDSSAVKPPQKPAEEPTYSSLAQRAQKFGGMRKKPPLRRAKSFQIGSSDSTSSPLATGLSRPTRVLKRQATATSFN